MDTQDVTLTRKHVKETYIFPPAMAEHSIILETLDEYPETWNFLGYAFKLQYFGPRLVCTESTRLYIEFPTLLSQWQQPGHWYFGLKLNSWLWSNKNVLDLTDPVNVRLSWF